MNETWMALFGLAFGMLIYLGCWGLRVPNYAKGFDSLRRAAVVPTQTQHYHHRARTCGYCGRAVCGCGAEDYAPTPPEFL